MSAGETVPSWDSVTYPLDILVHRDRVTPFDAGIQSPIPLIYLRRGTFPDTLRWDSVTYPLDILGRPRTPSQSALGFSHLSP